MKGQAHTDARASINSPEHHARLAALDSAADVQIFLTGIAASLRLVTAEMEGPEADAIRAHALSAEAAAQQAQRIIEHLEYSRV